MTTPQRLVRMLLALVLTCLAPVAAAAQVPQFDTLYAFGDSLLDTGNIFIHSKALGHNPAVPPSVSPHRTYFDGNFSNGFMEVEYLWQDLTGHPLGSSQGVQPFLKSPLIRKTGATNFAFGGTGTPYVDQTPGGDWAPGLKGQVELFRIALLGRKPSSRALYVIGTGANDYRADQFNTPMNPEVVVKNIEDAIVTLYRLGARHVMVFDLPDLGQVPANLGLPEPNPATLISAWHNSLLYPMLDGLRVRFPSLHLVTVELQPLFDTIEIANKTVPALDVYTPPPAPGMPPQSACLFVAPVLCQDVETSLFNNLNLGHVFWDIVHPTTEAHRHLADYMRTELFNSYDDD